MAAPLRGGTRARQSTNFCGAITVLPGLLGLDTLTFMTRRLFSLLLVLCLQPMVMGQAVGLGRGATLGKIEAAEKQDWKGAEVFFFSRPYTGCFEAGKPDMVRVLAGDKGRFQGKLIRGRVYDVWAIKKVKEGRYLSTNIAKSIVAGKLVELKANTREQMELRLRLLGQKRWPDRGPFSLQVTCRNQQGLLLDLAFDENGEAQLPAVPGSSVTVVVSAANGQRLISKKVSVNASTRKGIKGRLESFRKSHAAAKKKAVADAKKKVLEEAKKAEAAKKLEASQAKGGNSATKDGKKGKDPAGSAKDKETKKETKKEIKKDAAEVAKPIRGVETLEVADDEVIEDAVEDVVDIEQNPAAQKKKKKKAKKKQPPIPKEPFPEFLEGEIPGGDVELLVLPRAFKARFLVRDESESPMANVEVRHEYGDSRLGRYPTLGKTDEKGRVDLVVPQPYTGHGMSRAKPTMNFLFSGSEAARTQDGWTGYKRGTKEPMTNEEVIAGESEIRKVDLSTGFSVKGKVLWKKDEPAKNFPVAVGMPALVSYGPNSWGTSSHRSFLVYTDDQGDFLIPGWHQNLYGGTVSLWVDGKALAKRFSLDMEIPDSLIQPFPALNLWGQSGEVDMGSIYLSAMRVAQVEVRTGKGEQASFAEVAASLSQSMNWGNLDQDPAFFRVADRRGRAVILVPDSQRNLFVRLKGHGYFFGGMQIPEGEITMPLKVLPQLRPFSKVTGRVVDEKGKPISNANLSIRSSTMMGGGADVNMIYNLNWRLLRGKSDKQGYFALEFIPHPNLQFGVGVSARVEGQSYNASEMIQIGNEPKSGIEIEMPVNLAVAKKEAKKRAGRNAKTAVKDAGKAVKTAVEDAGAGIGSAFQGFLDRAKALADKKKATKAKAKKSKAGKPEAAAKKDGKEKTGGVKKGKTETPEKDATSVISDIKVIVDPPAETPVDKPVEVQKNLSRSRRSREGAEHVP
jgi:hypothetical protein